MTAERQRAIVEYVEAFVSHLQLKAKGGEIFVSDVVRQLAAGKGFLFADRGEAMLRGFEDPVRLYELGWQE